jgi:hypothetical protein
MAHMNSKARIVKRKHKRREERNKTGPQQSAMPEFWVYATGRISDHAELLSSLKLDFYRYGLKSFSIFSSKKADPGYVSVELKTRKTARFLLENTHMNLMTRYWDGKLKFHESLRK